MPNSIYANLLVGIIVTLFLWGKTGTINLLFWLSSMFVITIIRTVTLKFYHKKKAGSEILYYRIFAIQMIISTLIWGLSGFIIFSSDTLTNILVIVSILGIAIGGVSSLTSDLKLVVLFISLLMLPFTFRLLLFQVEFFNIIALLLTIFYILILLVGIRIHKLIFENIMFKEKHKKTMAELLLSENKFRSIFEHAPVGIFYYNKELIVYGCNEVFCSIFEAPRERLINIDIHDLKDKRILKAITDVFKNKQGYYEGEYQTTVSQSKIWVTLHCSPLFNDEQEIIGAVGIIQDRTEMQLIEEKVRHLAYHDSLTGLPNRLLLKDRIEQALSQSKRHNYNGAVLFLDLDNFKAINDSLGHHIGDKILKETAERIKAIVRIEDTVSRIGGDEFVVVLPKLHTESDSTTISANLVADKIHKALALPYTLLEKALYTSTSIGIVLFSDEDHNVDDLLKNADAAMYEAKKEGRGYTHFYNNDMNAAMIKRLGLENNLRNAIKNNELQPYFQPIYDSSENTLIGAETLLRWHHPKLGTISPVDFIPLAEETNLILPIGQWLIEEVCRKVRFWIGTYDNPIKYVSINISVNQLRQDNFSEIILNNIQKYNIPPAMIVLEITENVLIGNFDKISETVSKLRAKGIRFALDDFGTGYSSLTYLKKLELDIIKIDRAFIQDILNDKNDAALVDAILSIAHNFNMLVIAEGVEEMDQVKQLTNMGCNFFQGYYYSRPIPVIEFEKLFKS